MQNPEEIKQLADLRLEEADILCQAGKYNGAFYLAGYSIELILKAKLCENFDVKNLFDFSNRAVSFDLELFDNSQYIKDIRTNLKTHDIIVLLKFSGLYPKFKRISSSKPVLFKTIGLLFDPDSKKCFWSEQLRYEFSSRNPENVEELIRLLKEPNEGLLHWIENE